MRYLLFTCTTYYPSGGGYDFYHASNNLEELSIIAEGVYKAGYKLTKRTFKTYVDSFNVFDTEELKVVFDNWDLKE